ncbi:multicopper oxidase domain-containing protein [Prauserella oleivorans]
MITRPMTTPAEIHFGLTKFRDPLRIPPLIRPHSWWHQDEITVQAVRTRVKLHSELPETTVWAYDGQFPGPTIEVHSGKRLRVSWTNAIEGNLPLTGVRAPLDLAGPPEANPTVRPGYRAPTGRCPRASRSSRASTRFRHGR